jgi:hypothetical protein
MNLNNLFETTAPAQPEPNKDYAIYVDDAPVVKFESLQQAKQTYADLYQQFPEKKIEIRAVNKLRESQTNLRTAQALSRELESEMEDLMAIRHAGAATGAGNPHGVQSLINNIKELVVELNRLGYEFDPNTPGYLRPLTIDVDGTDRLREQRCVECGGAAFTDLILSEKKDACYYKVKSRYKVWPSAYASGALVQCRKKGSKNWGSKG